ncbi:beta-lactamase family protein [Solibacillus sp. MA9]|uniref:Beta-lactamase family protein n=1 Tax=Solibacillus palustris TaxID=2908203 RepID=A0ABS9UE81_9BACL|nr:beta-lactamase family protein [Solibacillus sp. MA9]MCH7322646.1 beta-lactamase family protein [Solibacillus sp. MA9]
MVKEIIKAVENTYKTLNCTGAALILYQNNELKIEKYWGYQSAKEDARAVQADTKFHLASCRKSYVAFAVAYALHGGFIRSLDDEILQYLPSNQQLTVYKGTTIRHLVTHSHGLNDNTGEVIREFNSGTSWAYRGINVELISQIIQHSTKRTIAEILQTEVFLPLSLKETNWHNTYDKTFVEVIGIDTNPHWSASQNVDGSKMNMYASARDFAQWGLLHINEGSYDGQAIINPELLKLATTIQSPRFSNKELPENGIFWFVKGSQVAASEIGENVPNDAYQILGYTTVTLLVIPSENIVAVRAFNSFGNPKGYDYLRDVKDFGNVIVQCFQ